MLLSSAYRTKRWPRRSNARSSSSSTRLLSSGESGPPCGVPSALGLTNPFSITPAFKNARMSFSSLLSSTRSAHQAVARAEQYIAEGYAWCVDFELEEFFDRCSDEHTSGRSSECGECTP